MTEHDAEPALSELARMTPVVARLRRQLAAAFHMDAAGQPSPEESGEPSDPAED